MIGNIISHHRIMEKRGKAGWARFSRLEVAGNRLRLWETSCKPSGEDESIPFFRLAASIRSATASKAACPLITRGGLGS